MMTNLNKSKGTSLIEVLVSVVVLSFGALGAAQLQIKSVKGVQNSYNLTSATILATSLMERMQNNQAATLADQYTLSAVPSAVKDCAAEICTSSELAAYDFKDWADQYPATMYNVSGQVARKVGTNEFTISVHWDDDRNGSAEKNCPPQSADDLDCYQLTVSL